MFNVTEIQRQQQEQMLQMFDMQQSRDKQLHEVLSYHQQSTIAMTLRKMQVPTFNGNPIEYCYFVRSFENLIEAKTPSHNARLFYLVQYTSGELQELVRSCPTMDPEEG